MSTELMVLTLAYRLVFLKDDGDRFKEAYLASNRQNLLRLASYHGVRPVLFDALKLAGINDALVQELFFITSSLAIRDKLNGVELAKLVNLLGNRGIRALPYKGYLFTEKIYQGHHFRESSDMDILVENRVEEAIRILIDAGYTLKTNADISNVLQNSLGREVELVRISGEGITYHLDFHWGINEVYHAYTVKTEDLFYCMEHGYLAGKPCLVPSRKGIFKMILNHHGARGQWLKLKEIFDFCQFVQNNRDAPLNRWAREMKMARLYETALSLGDMLEGAEHSPNTLENDIIKFWEAGESYKIRLNPKLRKLKIYLKIQDPEVNRIKLLFRFFKFHSNPDPLDPHEGLFKGRVEFLNTFLKFRRIYKREEQSS
jgi:hypothetical protein